MGASRNRLRFPATARVVAALRQADLFERVVYAMAGDEAAGKPLGAAGHPMEGVEWVTPELGIPQAPAEPTAPFRATTTEGGRTLGEIAKAEATRYRAMSPASRARYLRFTGPGWFRLLDEKRRAAILALPVDESR